MNQQDEYKIKIYLASRSPRRVELLKQIGVDCITMPADIDESQHPNEPPITYVLRMARQKAEVCLQQLGNASTPILAADTSVVHHQMLGKPVDNEDARRMLLALSGSTHEVHTAVALAFNGVIEVVLSTTRVEMMPLNLAQIEAYVDSGEPFDKAGGYGIQGLAGAWIKHIEGSYTGVMGLPIFETASLLRKHQLFTL